MQSLSDVRYNLTENFNYLYDSVKKSTRLKVCLAAGIIFTIGLVALFSAPRKRLNIAFNYFYHPIKNNTRLKVFLIVSCIFSVFLGIAFSVLTGAASMGISLLATGIFLSNRNKRKKTLKRIKYKEKRAKQPSKSESKYSLDSHQYHTSDTNSEAQRTSALEQENNMFSSFESVTDVYPRDRDLSTKEKQVLDCIINSMRDLKETKEKKDAILVIRSTMNLSHSYADFFRLFETQMEVLRGGREYSKNDIENAIKEGERNLIFLVIDIRRAIASEYNKKSLASVTEKLGDQEEETTRFKELEKEMDSIGKLIKRKNEIIKELTDLIEAIQTITPEQVEDLCLIRKPLFRIQIYNNFPKIGQIETSWEP